ncbi:flagellar hook-associated protein FlgK [Nocardioides sp. zg-1228]|uniref:flagellar hook-associated protein FlgK n=1 Tax=Nocardioides sp. zg-1228 TaxID=2763008 RepID=UPI001642A0A8|nr:flagellar hook-associated protein FlgK [Nocardioides sp. zg-1228]MBC2932314.1 flagellar hook-associated protein FlgK [Nocardioides sp. zg-1228]QSF57832.1 flagellar hook-associated protein FlgK [Nocardioides sp. zg-1228]
MAGTFGSISTSASALRYHQAVMEVASGNIANVATDGYARRRVVGLSVGAPAQPAMWSRYEGHGEGVRVGSVDRLVDPLLDARARREHGSQAYLDTRAAALARVEASLGEPAGDGISGALGEVRKAWHDLANHPDSAAVRSQVLATSQTLVEAVAAQRRNVAAEEGDQRMSLLADVGETNTLARDLAAANEAITAARLSNTDASGLLDARDQMALRLAELTGGTAVENGQGGLDVSVGGVALVTGSRAGSLAVTSGVAPDGTADGAALALAVTGPDGATTPVSGLRGEIGGTSELLTTTLPGLRADLQAVAQHLADAVNAAHGAGHDASGAPGQPVFAVDPNAPGGPLVLLLTDPAALAASGVAGGANRDGSNATAVAAALGGPEQGYQRFVSVLGTEVSSVRRLAAAQAGLTGQVDGAREQLSGVNLDEEMVTMMQAQRAYEAAARVMTTLDSVLDTLINRTGLVR